MNDLTYSSKPKPAEQPADEGLDETTCSPSSPREPLRRAYSREELASAMAEWMVNTFGHPLNDINDTERLDRWYRDNGMLYQFICASRAPCRLWAGRRAQYYPHPKTSMKTTTKKAARRTSAKPLRTKGTPGEDGNLTGAEIRKLVMQAKEAFHYQSALGQIEPGADSDQWRRDQVMDCVDKAGTSKLIRREWRKVSGHFLILAGREDEALATLNRTGVKSYRPVDQEDTWETSETYVALIRAALADHRATVVTPENGHLHEGWLLAAARQRTGKPTLTMGTLAERLAPQTLCGLLAHLRNHIALREGRAISERRSKRFYPTTPDPGEMDDPF